MRTRYLGQRILPGRARGFLRTALLVAGLVAWLPAHAALARSPQDDAPAAPRNGPTRGEPLTIRRAAGPIEVDGRIDDPGWQGATRVDTWFETNPGDNLPVEGPNAALLTYDDRFFYAAFELTDPRPGAIRAPLGDHDQIGGGNYADYAGVILDTTNDGKTAVLLLTNPRGVQYDAVTSDASGEDESPDFFWDSKARITETGWTLEMRVPFSSLRYQGSSPEWGILLYRNMPRDFRTQHFTSRLPRGENCFICHSHPLRGLEGLPEGGSLVVAPYATAAQSSAPRAGLGTPLEDGSAEGELGLDVKWLPFAGLALDATVNPDFSQVEADVPQIAANERFALFFPEKRPFFLEGIDLFSTPIRAVYTRAVTEPDWGARATGRWGDTAYALLVTDDEGGGSVILPGPLGSTLAPQDFGSTVALGRLRHDLGRSFVSVLFTDRESDGGAFNRVVGPDFEWRPTPVDTVSGQLLWSETRTPNRPGLAAEWDGRELSGHAARVWWSHGTETVDWYASYWDYADEFRADSGFVPQVGFREAYGEAGYTFRPEEGAVRRLRTFVFADRTEDRDGEVVFQGISPGFGMNAKWNSFVGLNLAFDEVRSGPELFETEKLVYQVELTPSLKLSRVALSGEVGEAVDFANHRLGEGATVRLGASVRPTAHLEILANADRRWLDLDEAGARGRLFTADVGRLRAQYTFNARSYLRLIGQWVETERDPGLYTFTVGERSADLTGSALFAYKLNWQTVLFLGYGEGRTLLTDPARRDETYEPSGREVFLKLSYAIQR